MSDVDVAEHDLENLQIALRRAQSSAANYKRGWLEKTSESEAERYKAALAEARVVSVMSLLERTCCQIDASDRTCRSELEHKRDWCMHCRVSASLELEA